MLKTVYWANNVNFANTPASLTVTNFNKEKIKPFSGTAPGYDANGNIQFLERTNAAGTPTEKFQYNYTANTNKLASITNIPAGTTYASYTYDLLGQLTYENTLNAAQKKYIKYDVTGKVVMVSRNATFTQPVVEYVYNELGQRIVKKLYNTSYAEVQRTYYAGDVIYTQPIVNNVPGAITAQEYEIDGGSGRIGIYYRPSTTYAYQLTDHLGNVRAVVAKNGTTLQVRLYNDYYPYGMVITPQTTGTNDYRYGYQGQYAEKDPETDWNAFELRMYDSRIARWLSVDPKNQFHSPYVSMGNNPVSGVNPDGGKVKGEFEFDKNTNTWVKTSTKGDDIGVDFYHMDNFPSEGGRLVQMTYVTDRKGNSNFMLNGRESLRGEVRNIKVDWSDITSEFFEGTRPETSFFGNFHPSIPWIKASYQYKDAYNEYLASGKDKARVPVDFGLVDIILSGDNMQTQMMGSFSTSFYKLGNKTMVLINDSKTRESLYYHLPGIQNYNRGSVWEEGPNGGVIFDDRKTNTYQNYLFWH